MRRKPISWATTVLIFFLMATASFAALMAFFSNWRHQAGSIHSEFWQLVFPSYLIVDAAFAIGGRFIVNWAWTMRRCAIAEAPPSSRS